MQSSIKKTDKKFTYKDYLSWTDDQERWELIDGIAYDMSPAPTREHQYISSYFTSKFFEYLKGKDCNVFAAPFDVRLPGGFKANEDVNTVVQPDISVFCDKTMLDDRGANGAPDLIIEILSPSTASKDLKEKFFLYEKVGVKEYWVVDPANRTLTVFVLDKESKYPRGVVYAGEDVLKPLTFDGLDIKIKELFAN